MTEREIVHVADRAAWRRWLAAHHATSPTIWLALPKGDRRLTYDDVVEEALCFGWIDGQARSLDDAHSLRLLTRRRKGSGWSRVNKRRLERLEGDGLMTDAGRAAVERAKADGSWELLDPIEDGVVPDDLAAALDSERWEALPASQRKLVLHRVYSAKRPETRARRIAQVAGIVNAGGRIA